LKKSISFSSPIGTLFKLDLPEGCDGLLLACACQKRQKEDSRMFATKTKWIKKNNILLLIEKNQFIVSPPKFIYNEFVFLDSDGEVVREVIRKELSDYYKEV